MPHFTTADGVRLAYRSQGDGPHTVLLVHGWSTDGSAWQGGLMWRGAVC